MRCSRRSRELVHVRTHGEQLTIEPATLANAEAFWKAHQPTLAAPVADLTVTELRSFSTLRASDAKAYGTKAANLGELYALLAEENRTTGFGVPFSAYDAFMREQNLDVQVSALLNDPDVKSDAEIRSQKLKALRNAIKAAPGSAAFLTALRNAATGVWGESGLNLRLKFRSSTNAEDLRSPRLATANPLAGAPAGLRHLACPSFDLDSEQRPRDTRC